MANPIQAALKGGEGGDPVPTEHYRHDGVVYAAAFPSDILERIKTFNFRDHDVVVVAYPKSGTTWMQEIAYLVHHDGDLAKAQSADIMVRVPFIELAPPIKGLKYPIDILEQQATPRIMKTHLPVEYFEKPMKEKKTKFIVVMRNPKDVLVSYFHFYRINRGYGPFTGTWDEFFQKAVSGELSHGDWFDHVLGWWKYKDNANVLILFYEDMLRDLADSVKKVSDFMGKQLSAQTLKDICNHVTFDNMKKNPAANYTNHPLFDQKLSPFMRKGMVGDWKNYFSERQSQGCDNLVQSRLQPVGLKPTFEA